jgi:hypothetical protein
VAETSLTVEARAAAAAWALALAAPAAEAAASPAHAVHPSISHWPSGFALAFCVQRAGRQDGCDMSPAKRMQIRAAHLRLLRRWRRPERRLPCCWPAPRWRPWLRRLPWPWLQRRSGSAGGMAAWCAAFH